MRILLAIVLLLGVFTASAQKNKFKGAGFDYTKTAPNYIPVRGTESEIAIDSLTGKWMQYSYQSAEWWHLGYFVTETGTSGSPSYTPNKVKSVMAINAGDSLYHYRAGTWYLIAGGGGAGITDGDKGDVDVTDGGTVWTIDTGAITMIKINQAGAAVGQVIKWNGTAWAPADDETSATGAGGLYGPSDLVTYNHVATLDSGLTFSSAEDTAYFRIIMAPGAFGTAAYFNSDSIRLRRYDVGGSNEVILNADGVLLKTTGPDRATIQGADAQYAADYRATYSDRSLIDKKYGDDFYLQEVDSLRVSNDTLYISLARDSVPEKFVVLPASDDTSGYNSVFRISNDTLYIEDADGALFVDLEPYKDNTDTSGYNMSFTRSNDTLYLSDGDGTLFVKLPASTDTSGYNQDFRISNDSLYIRDGDGELFVNLDAYRDTIDVGIINALDYGVTGDGVTDDTDSLQAAIDAAVGRKLWIPSGRYLIAEELNVQSNTTILMAPDAVIDISDMPQASTLAEYIAIKVSGTTSTTTAFTADIALGDHDITVTSTTGFTKGTMVDITSTEPLFTGYTNRYKGYVTYVDSVLSSTVLRLANKSPYAIDAVGGSYTATLRKYVPIENVRITGGKIIGGGFDKGHVGVYCSNFRNCIFESMVIDSCESNGFWFGTGIQQVVRNCRILNATSATYGIGTTGYGVGIGSGFGALIEHNYFEMCRHSVAAGGTPPSFNALIKDNYSYNCGIGTDDYDCHGATVGFVFENNTSHAGAEGRGGFIIRSVDAVLKGNHTYGCGIVIRNADAITADANGPLGRVSLTDNIIKNHTSGIGIELDEVGIKYVSITGGVIEKCSVGVKVTNTLSGINISNVQFVDITAQAITVDDCTGLVVNGCTFDSCTIGVETLSSSRNIVVSNCVGTCTASLINAYLSDNINVSNCNVDGIATSSAMFFNRTNNVRVVGNNISMTSGASYDAIRAWGSSATAHNITAIGNKVTGSFKYGLYCFSNSDTITAIGNDFRQAITAAIYTPDATRVYFFANVNHTWDHGDIDEGGSGPGLTIDTSAVTSLKILDNTVALADMAANSIDSTKIINGGVSVLDIGQHGASSGQILKWNGTQWAPGADDTGEAGAGQNNVGENLGSGTGIYAGKTDTTLQFKSLVEGYGIDLSSTGTDITIAADTTQLATLHDVAVVQGDIDAHELADGDLDDTNELQSLTIDSVAITGKERFLLEISDGNTVAFDVDLNTDTQDISIDSAATTGGQNFTVTLQDGGDVDFFIPTNTDNQTLILDSAIVGSIERFTINLVGSPSISFDVSNTTGTVTSVAATQPAAGITISGSPITGSGTLTFALANDLAGLEGQSGTGIVVRTGDGTYAQRTATVFSSVASTANLAIGNANGVSGNPLISIDTDRATNKLFVQAVSTTNLDLNGTETIDGVSVTNGQRVLVAGQTAQEDNGIWDVVSAGAWTRSTDANTSGKIDPGILVHVKLGVTYGGTMWRLTTVGPYTVGTTDLVFEEVFKDEDPTNELQTIDTLSLSGTIMSLSLEGDGLPASTLDFASIIGSAADVVTLEDSTELKAYTGSATGIILKQAGRQGTFVKVPTTRTHDGFIVFTDGNGNKWQRIMDNVINVKWFGAKGDGVTDDTWAIQRAIDYSIYEDTLIKQVFIPSGNYVISKTIHLGYGNAYHSVSLIGDGAPTFRGEIASFNGTMLSPTFSDAPAINIQGARYTTVENITLVGLNDIVGFLSDTSSANINNWLDGGLDPIANNQRTPYAGITIDAYSGTAPSPGYPHIVYPTYAGDTSQYSKDFSSQVKISNVGIHGFVAGIVLQPNSDGNGDLTQVEKCIIDRVAYGISVGNANSRNFKILDCYIDAHTGITNSTHGNQTGRVTLIQNNHFGGYQWFALNNLPYLEGLEINNNYGESFYWLGSIGSVAGNQPTITFNGCDFSMLATSQGTLQRFGDFIGGGAYVFNDCSFKNNRIYQFNNPNQAWIDFNQCKFNADVFEGEPGDTVETYHDIFFRNMLFVVGTYPERIKVNKSRFTEYTETNSLAFPQQDGNGVSFPALLTYTSYWLDRSNEGVDVQYKDLGYPGGYLGIASAFDTYAFSGRTFTGKVKANYKHGIGTGDALFIRDGDVFLPCMITEIDAADTITALLMTGYKYNTTTGAFENAFNSTALSAANVQHISSRKFLNTRTITGTFTAGSATVTDVKYVYDGTDAATNFEERTPLLNMDGLLNAQTSPVSNDTWIDSVLSASSILLSEAAIRNGTFPIQNCFTGNGGDKTAIPVQQIVYGNGNDIKSEAAFLYDSTNNRVILNGTSGERQITLNPKSGETTSTGGIRINSSGVADVDPVGAIEFVGNTTTGPYTQRGAIAFDIEGSSAKGQALVFRLSTDGQSSLGTTSLYEHQLIVNNSSAFNIANNTGRLELGGSTGIYSRDKTWLLGGSAYTTANSNVRLKLAGDNSDTSTTKYGLQIYNGFNQSYFSARNDGNIILGGRTVASEFQILEASGSGTNYTGFKAQPMSANLMYTLPAATGTAGQQLTWNSSNVLTWEDAGGSPVNIYTADGNVKDGGTIVDVSGNDPIILALDNATTEQNRMLRLTFDHTDDVTNTYGISFVGPNDSLEIRSYDSGMYLDYEGVTSSGEGLVISSNTILDLRGDSILVSTLPTRTTLPFMVGLQGNTLSKIEGTTDGQVLVWDETNGGFWEIGTSAGADGDGIYDGSGTIAAGAIATLASAQTFAIAYDGGNEAIYVDDAGYVLIGSKDAGTYLAINNGGSILTSDVGVATSVEGNVFEVNANQFVFTADTGTVRLTLFEPSGSGTNYTMFTQPAMAASQIYALPTDAPANGDVLSWNTGGTLSWEAGGGADGDGIYDGDGTLQAGTTNATLPASGILRIEYNGGNAGLIVDDGNNATTILSKDGTQFVSADNTQVIIGSGTSQIEYIDGVLKLYDSDATQSVSIQPPATGTLTTSYTLTLPADDGTSGQVLQTDGAGVLSWATAGGGAVATDAIWDAKGDLAVGTGANTGAKLTVGANGKQIYADSGESTGLRWGPDVISPSQITADQDDYTPTGWADAQIVRLDGDNGIRAITSMAAGYSGEIKQLINVGSHPIYFPGEHPDGTAANRIDTEKDIVLFPKKSVQIYYDGTASRWRILGHEGGAKDGKSILYDIFPGTPTGGDWGDRTFTTINSGSITGANAGGGYPGYYQLNTLANTNGGAAISTGKTSIQMSYLSNAHIFAEAFLSIPTLSDATNTYEIGLQITEYPTSPTLVPNNTIGIRYTHGTNSGKFQGYNKNNAGSESTVDLGITVATGTLYKLRVEIDKGKSETRFYVDGVFCGRATSNMPNSVAIGARAIIVKSAGASTRELRLHNLTAGAIYP